MRQTQMPYRHSETMRLDAYKKSEKIEGRSDGDKDQDKSLLVKSQQSNWHGCPYMPSSFYFRG